MPTCPKTPLPSLYSAGRALLAVRARMLDQHRDRTVVGVHPCARCSAFHLTSIPSRLSQHGRFELSLLRASKSVLAGDPRSLCVKCAVVVVVVRVVLSRFHGADHAAGQARPGDKELLVIEDVECQHVSAGWADHRAGLRVTHADSLRRWGVVAPYSGAACKRIVAGGTEGVRSGSLAGVGLCGRQHFAR